MHVVQSGPVEYDKKCVLCCLQQQQPDVPEWCCHQLLSGWSPSALGEGRQAVEEEEAEQPEQLSSSSLVAPFLEWEGQLPSLWWFESLPPLRSPHWAAAWARWVAGQCLQQSCLACATCGKVWWLQSSVAWPEWWRLRGPVRSWEWWWWHGWCLVWAGSDLPVASPE